jgi:hypothetical protein
MPESSETEKAIKVTYKGACWNEDIYGSKLRRIRCPAYGMVQTIVRKFPANYIPGEIISKCGTCRKNFTLVRAA